MNTNIRKMTESDRIAVVDMMRTFYHSPAVFTNGSEEIYNNDITACVTDNPYAEGFIFENEKEILGYGMIAKSFSTEFGKICIWIEDLQFIAQLVHIFTILGKFLFRQLYCKKHRL